MSTITKIIDTKDFEIFKIKDCDTEEAIKYINSSISAGFPNMASDYLEEQIDLNVLLVKDRLNSYLLKAKGDCLKDILLHSDDLVLINTRREPKDKELCVCFLDGEYTLKAIKKTKGKIFLMPFNADFKPIEVDETNRFSIWGVLMWSFHKHYIGN